MKTNISASEVPFEISMNHPKKCPSCGTENRVDSLLCCRCGAKFDGSELSSAVTDVPYWFDKKNEPEGDYVLITPKKFGDFYIGKYEVTQKLWNSVMETNPSKFKGDNRPVDSVSWYDAVEFCNRLSVKEGLIPCYTGNTRDSYLIHCNFEANGYRLPRAKEWQEASKGGGINILDLMIWIKLHGQV